MKTNKLFFIIINAIFLVAVSEIVWACFSSTVPPKCARTIYLAKYTPSNIVIPPGGNAFIAPIGVEPYLEWDNTNPACAQPVSASLELSLVCNPSDGSPQFTIGPQTFNLSTPLIPGPQPVPAGVINFNIPAGMKPSVCSVIGKYTVAFGSGIGSSSLSASGDTPICFLPPSPSDPTKPLANLEVIYPNDEPYGVNIRKFISLLFRKIGCFVVVW